MQCGVDTSEEGHEVTVKDVARSAHIGGRDPRGCDRCAQCCNVVLYCLEIGENRNGGRRLAHSDEKIKDEDKHVFYHRSSRKVATNKARILEHCVAGIRSSTNG